MLALEHKIAEKAEHLRHLRESSGFAGECFGSIKKISMLFQVSQIFHIFHICSNSPHISRLPYDVLAGYSRLNTNMFLLDLWAPKENRSV